MSAAQDELAALRAHMNGELGPLDNEAAKMEAVYRLAKAAPDLLAAAQEAREALHDHYVAWDGEPEDAVPLQRARATCDAAIAKATVPVTTYSEAVAKAIAMGPGQ